jgi:hypothetical protein
MRALKYLVMVLLPVTLLTSTCLAKAKPSEGTTTVKGYTTKTGKVVKPYMRKKGGVATFKPPAPLTKGTEAAKSTAAKAGAGAKGTVKSYTTKSGKVVKSYTRKTTKVVPPVPTRKVTGKAAEEGKTVHVKGYTTKTGKVVKPYMRRPPTKKK